MKQLAFKKSLNISPYQKPNLLDFFGNPSIAFSWLFSNIPSKTEVTERDKEERVEKFWRGLSILGGISFFAGYLINRHRI